MKYCISVFTIAAFTAVFMPGASFAQSYNTAAGIRVDKGFNFTAQQYIADGWTVEAIFHTPIVTKNVGVTFLAEKHFKVISRGFNFYAGGGPHYYWRKGANGENADPYRNVFGLSGIAGLELSLGRFNLSADVKPEFHLSGDISRVFSWNGVGVSCRYIIDKRERKKDWDVRVKIRKRKA
ncbi:MAG: hypothetical protein ACK5FV_15520 [Bacteroidota bacterium]|jgi:hypothetical protein